MALRTPPSWLAAGTHTAENDRLGTKGIWQTAGVRLGVQMPQTAGGTNTGDFAVTQSGTPAMSVAVAAGWAYVAGSSTSTQGVYGVYNDASVTLTVTSNASGNPRIDLVCVTVRDAGYSGANNDVILQVVAGTPAVSPVAPALPASSLSLATIAVANGAASITNANITDTRVKAAIQDLQIQASAATTTPLRLQLAASQSANAMEIVNSSGTVVYSIPATGGITVSGDSDQIVIGVQSFS